MYRALSRIAALGRSFPIRVTTVVRPVLKNTGYNLSSSRPAVTFVQHENPLRTVDTGGNDSTYRETTVEVRDDWPAVTDERFAALVAQDWSVATVDAACDGFLSVTAYAPPKGYQLQDTVFDGLRERLTAVLPDMTDEQLMDTLQMIARWKVANPNDPVYFKFWSQFDKQCLARYKNWSLNKLLLYMDLWYVTDLIKLSDFVWFGMKKLVRKPSRYYNL